MAPRPICESTSVRCSRPRPPAKPSIYAISSGPQRGVHLLASEPIPAEVQYLYRHPINVHKTFLTVSGDFLRRRFDSIDSAVRWIDERDRDEELANALGGTSLTPVVKVEKRRDEEERVETPSSAKGEIWTGLAAEGPEAPPSTPVRPRRASEPVSYSPCISPVVDRTMMPRRGDILEALDRIGRGGIIKKSTKNMALIKKPKYGTSHLGVRRKDLLYRIVSSMELDPKEQQENRTVEMQIRAGGNENLVGDDVDMEL